MKYPALLLLAAIPHLLAAAPAMPAATSNGETAITKPALPPPDPALLEKARMLRDETRYLDAAAIYEKQSKLHPENGWLKAQLARVLSMQAHAETSAAKSRKLNKRARQYAEEAEKLGAGDAITVLIMQAIKADGTPAAPVATPRTEVDKLMRDGEAAFGRHDLAKARACYQQALALDPSNYLAAVWTGDTYFNSKDFQTAIEWFEKAIAIDPDQETAHRYRGDALRRQGRHEDALAEHINAVICAPYNRQTRQNFPEELRNNAETRGRIVPRFPAMQSTLKDGKIELAYDPNDGVLMLAYNVSAVGWRMKEFATTYPEEKSPRRSLAEEVGAIAAMLEVADSVAADTTKPDELTRLERWRETVAGLKTLTHEGLLEAYVLLERPDAELVRDYAAYRANHRDKLERYIRVYWCSFE